jgi:sterol 3beta-glucosyltransferase
MVHHGGAGTSHAALRAGIPAVVVPFIFEQQIWANRLRAAGVSARSVPFWKATAEGLAERVREVAGSEALRQRAAELGQRAQAEDGNQRAVELIERLRSP